MEKEQFVEVIRNYVRDVAIEVVINRLNKPSGRKPRPKYVAQSHWFLQLEEQDKQFVREIIEESIDEAIFGVFTTLDGVRPIEDPDTRGELVLNYSKDGITTRINSSNGEYLHDIYNWLNDTK